MLDGAAPVSLTVPVVATPPVTLPANPAVTVTGKKVISDGCSIVVDNPGKFAPDPPKDSMHIPAVEPVKVQSIDAVKSGTTWLYRKLLAPSVMVTGSL